MTTGRIGAFKLDRKGAGVSGLYPFNLESKSGLNSHRFWA